LHTSHLLRKRCPKIIELYLLFEDDKRQAKYILDVIKKNPSVKVGGHFQFAAKDCPSFDTVKWCKSIGVQDINIYMP